MKRTVLFALMLAAVSAAAQQRNPVVPSFTGAVEDFKPNVTNQLGHQYPMVNSQGAVRAQLRAPQAQAVQLDIAGKRYEMTKRTSGIPGAAASISSPSCSSSSAYPNTTSSTIIRMKPRANPMVPMFECSPWEYSGTSSSTTT